MTALIPIAPRLARLIPRLASDQDGEVVATARAIARTLKAAGRDFHDLADAIGREPEPRVICIERAPDEPLTWRELAAWCAAHDAGRLDAKERRFVHDMRDRLVLGGCPTEKQAKWLRSLYARLRRDGAS